MIPVKIRTQPDDITCGPTSLLAVYEYYDDKVSLEQVINEVSYLDEGGTLAVFLACHALKRGYKATIYTYNLNIFDPSWFLDEPVDITEKLKAQMKHKNIPKVHKATKGYLEFLGLGGTIKCEDLTASLLTKFFLKGIPILTGLSSTFLYQCPREYTDSKDRAKSDDTKGYPQGHFVVLCGFDEPKEHVIIADPYAANPVSGDNYYPVTIERLINSILLGIVTYDANLLIIEKKLST